MSQIKRLAGLIEQESGNVVPEGQYPYLRGVAAKRARKAGFAELGSYLEALAEGRLNREWRHLLPEITIKESYLFRLPEHFRALREEILPRLAERTGGEPLRIWSAGCARGEEASSIAVVLADTPCTADRAWEILATDIDEEALDEARTGEYCERAVAQMPEDLRDRYLHCRDNRYTLSRQLLARIEYRTFNLIKDPLPYLDVPFDVIFLRNVLIYFRPELQRRVLARIARRLAPDGHLFLGHSETLWQLSEELEIVELAECMAYRFPRPSASRRSGRTSGGRAARRPKKSVSVKRTPPAAKIALPEGSPRRAGAEENPSADLPDAHLLERPAPADAEGRSAPGQEIEAAVRALAVNDLELARELVQDRLKANFTDADANALQGLIHDLEGRARRAVAAYRAALFLDPDLFQVRFLLAGRLEHLGWPARARSEYRQVLSGLESGSGRELSAKLPDLLPSRDETAQRCRRALSRV